MKILYFSPFWGSEYMGLESFFKRVVNTGYDGVEIAVPFDNKFEVELRNLLKITGLKLIGHQHLPPQKETVDDYLKRLEYLLAYLISRKPIFINSHA
jgi:sugar phosphate isomerase/epimerase